MERGRGKMNQAIEVIREDLTTTGDVPDEDRRKNHQNRLAELGHPLLKKVEIPRVQHTYEILDSIGFLWKVNTTSLRKLPYVAGFCLDRRMELKGGRRDGRRHSCVRTWFGNAVVYKGDIPGSTLDNIDQVRKTYLKAHGQPELTHFTIHSHQPLPVKVEGPNWRSSIQRELEWVDPVLVVWPVRPTIRTGTVFSNNRLWSIKAEYPGVVIGTWDMETDG